jgi:hypothetical protein
LDFTYFAVSDEVYSRNGSCALNFDIYVYITYKLHIIQRW